MLSPALSGDLAPLGADAIAGDWRAHRLALSQDEEPVWAPQVLIGLRARRPPGRLWVTSRPSPRRADPVKGPLAQDYYSAYQLRGR